jgi:arylsulfatase A-like enzyme
MRRPSAILAVLLAALLNGAALCAPGDAPRLNVIFLLADDLRPDALACTGNPAVKTPNLDRLAARGTLLTRATCGYPICHVSRAEILTGRSLTNADMPGHPLTIDPQWTLWPEAMRRAGWHTAYSGKWHTPGTPQSRGYAETSGLFSSGGAKGLPLTFPLSGTGRKVTGYTGWTFKGADGKAIPGDTVGLTPETDARIADGAIALIRARKAEPFFLHVNFTAPHDPLHWPRGGDPRTDAASLTLPANFRAEHPFDHGNLAGRDEVIVPAPRSAEDVKRERAVYFSLVENVDAQAGRILRALEEAGVMDRTLVIFSSDHGLALGSHGLMGKQNQYEHTIGVPLIIAGPLVRAGARLDAPCYLRDLFPTVCDITGIAVPPSVQGRSFLTALLATCFPPIVQNPYPAIYGRFTDTQRMMRTADGWKIIWYPKAARTQLFHVSQDPDELRDLAGDRGEAERLRRMMADLQSWLRDQGDATAETR